MADSLSVLFQLKAQNSASPVVKTVQQDVANLSQNTTKQFNAMQQISTAALGKISSSLTNLSSQIPVVGKAVESLSSELSTMAGTTAAAGTEFAALAGPIGAAVVATGAMAFAVIKLGEALVTIAVQAGEAQGKLFDLSQQTGVSVETLAALDLLAKTTGGSIESLSASLGIFQKNLEEATDPASKAAETFRRIGVEVTNTEDTLRQTLVQLAKMPEGFRQTSLALEIFGRGGKQFLAILKEAHGDIDQTIRELQRLGLANSANAKQADEFNDQLVKLNTQLLGITVTIGNQVIPQLLTGLKELEKFIKNNKDAIDALAIAVKAIAFLFIQPFKGAIVAVTSVLRTHAPEVRLVVELYERLAAAMQAVAGTAPNVSPNAIPPQSARPTSGLDLLNEARDAVRRTPQLPPAGPDFANDPNLLKKTGKSAEEDGLQLLRQLRNETLKLDEATREQIIRVELLDKKYKDLAPSLRDQIVLAARLIDQKKAQAEVDKALKDAADELKATIQSERATLQSFQEAQIEALNGSKTAAEEVRLVIFRTNTALSEMSEKTRQSTIHWLKFNAALIDSRKNLAELGKIVADTSAIDLGGRVKPTDPNSPLPTVDVGEPPPNISIWEKAIGSLQERMKFFSDFMRGTFVDSIQGVSEALGQGVATWALYGGSFADAMKQSLAALGAKIAAEATLQAALHAAYAIASLAIGDFSGAAQHGIAAAKFAGVAALAAIGARALSSSVAGGAFSGGGGSGGSAAAPGGRTTNRSSDSQAVDIDRRRVGRQTVETIHFRVRGIDVVNEFVRDYNLNGPTRVIITGDKP